jgi:hypothetical protein
MAQPVTRPDRELARSKRDKFVNTGQAAAMLDGMLSAQQIRSMALKGEIRGAVRVRQRVYVPRYIVPTLIQELYTPAASLPRPMRHPPRNTYDGGVGLAV